MNEKIREVYIEFRPTECWRRLASEYETWFAWTQADGEWQVLPRGIKTDACYGLKFGSEVYCPWILVGAIEDWMERLFNKMKRTEDASAKDGLSFFCEQLLAAGVASEIVEKNVWTFKE